MFPSLAWPSEISAWPGPMSAALYVGLTRCS